MIFSMTGFGRGEASAEGIRVYAEIRTVNNRYLDFGYRAPRSLQNFEPELRELCRSRIQRGKLNLTLNESRGVDAPSVLRIDTGAAQKLARELHELAVELGLHGGLSLEHLLHFPEILFPVENPQVAELMLTLARAATEAALADLKRMREAEGRNLADDLLERTHEIERALGEIVEKQDGLPQRALEKMRERIKRLVAGESYDDNRLEMELAFLADRLDITEEAVRLRGHIAAFRKTLESPAGTAGKRLEFLLQEMNRESNTIGSKTSSLDISHLSLRMREEIERMREQVQNIE
ncbi:YicC family protein [candidate division KSB1 bacterium]|nr:YicC family protein [candidate division KSB1 bacterium]